LGQDVEIRVPVDDWYVTADGNRGDQAIKQLAHGVPPLATGSVECRCCVIVDRFHRKGGRSGEKSTKLLKVFLVAGTSEYFHANDVTGGDLHGQQIIHALTDRGTGVAQKLDPSRSVDQDHDFRWTRISPSSPIQPEPLSFRASSSPSGSAASVRNAKLMASRFVANRYRRITLAHASSSISTFVRDIH